MAFIISLTQVKVITPFYFALYLPLSLSLFLPLSIFLFYMSVTLFLMFRLHLFLHSVLSLTNNLSLSIFVLSPVLSLSLSLSLQTRSSFYPNWFKIPSEPQRRYLLRGLINYFSPSSSLYFALGPKNNQKTFQSTRLLHLCIHSILDLFRSALKCS